MSRAEISTVQDLKGKKIASALGFLTTSHALRIKNKGLDRRS